jgi:2-polyprenyl-6-hydroxyphenyl methylase/3-demethylubiquinone-9 3-methyltransferase
MGGVTDERATVAEASPRFAFGDNWASYASLVNEERLVEAERGLVRLLGPDGLRGRTMLDIGCGSGVHAAAAGRLGVARVVALDIDSRSVEATRAVLMRHAPLAAAEVRQADVFDLEPATAGRFDVVYSWGVLHHTGDMGEAVRRAAGVVAPGGLFAFALYRRTRLCGLWAHEKRWYAAARPSAQAMARRIYVGLLRAKFAITGQDFATYVAKYKSARGMDFLHDVHDWMGGYPYESITPAALDDHMRKLGFEHVRSFTQALSLGLFGSGCDEYVYRRPA